MTGCEEDLIEAALEWAELKRGAEFIPIQEQVRKAENILLDRANEVAADRV